MLIARQALDDFLSRDLDDYTWMKRLTREQILREMRGMRVRPYFKTESWLHQLVCFWIGLHRPEFLYLLDMGLGKTKIILDLVTHRVREQRIERALVGVPRRINLESWADDIERHSDLAPNIIRAEDIDEKWELLSQPGKSELTVIDYQSLHWALSRRRGGRGKGSRELVPDEERCGLMGLRYQLINLDESHKLANHQSLWFSLLRRLCRSAQFTYAETGTLFGKDVEAIWPQFFLVDKGETFGENLGLFRKAFFNQSANKWGRGEKYEFDPNASRRLHRMLQHRSIRYDEDEVLDLPPRAYRRDRYEMTGEQRGHYMNALQGLINAHGNLQEMEGQWVQMRRIISGYIKWKDEHGDHVVRFKQNPKLDGVMARIDEMGSTKAVICYDYTETGRMLCERLKEEGHGHVWLYGGTKDPAAVRRSFMEDDRVRVLVMNSAAGAEGNDGLQKVARYMHFYETPTPPQTRRQAEKRIHRPGQDGRTFFFDHVMRMSLDGGILQDLAEHRDTYATVVAGKRKPGKGFFLNDD